MNEGKNRLHNRIRDVLQKVRERIYILEGGDEQHLKRRIRKHEEALYELEEQLSRLESKKADLEEQGYTTDALRAEERRLKQYIDDLMHRGKSADAVKEKMNKEVNGHE